MKQKSRYLALLVLGLNCSQRPLPFTSSDITVEELRYHVRYLASDELEGRFSGTRGNDLAARYIAEHFSQYGLQSKGDTGTYFQHFQFLSSIKPGKNNKLFARIGGKKVDFLPTVDFVPMVFSADTSVSGNLVFVGYGISSDSLNFDDYASVDVHNKIVMVLRFTPDYGRPESKFDAYAPLYRKAFIAREKGAAGMILVTGPADEDKPGLINPRLERDLASAGIGAVNLKSIMADSVLHIAGVKRDLRAIQQSIYDTKAPLSFEVSNITVTMQTQLEKVHTTTANVVGFFEGSDPALKNEVVVLGAHFDHLGWGGEGSGSLRPDTVAIHHGADDNASGTAAVLELAQAISSQRNLFHRSYLFIAFSGEELGLLGSAHYVAYPTVPLEHTIAMINLDMVGRLKDSALTVEGIGTSPVWKPILEKENATFNFKLRLGQGGFGPSDHSSFYGKDLPVLFFFTGLHDDYHRPSDRWEKINYEGERSIASYVLSVVKALDASEKPAFTKVQSTAGGPGERRGMRVSLGIVPDYSAGENGLKISGTRPGSPASRAGLAGGDVITRFGGKEVKNIYDLTYLLQDHKPGDEVEVLFRRGEQTITATVKLEARQ